MARADSRLLRAQDEFISLSETQGAIYIVDDVYAVDVTPRISSVTHPAAPAMTGNLTASRL
jgi:hypothetical protein